MAISDEDLVRQELLQLAGQPDVELVMPLDEQRSPDDAQKTRALRLADALGAVERHRYLPATGEERSSLTAQRRRSVSSRGSSSVKRTSASPLRRDPARAHFLLACAAAELYGKAGSSFFFFCASSPGHSSCAATPAL